MNKAVIYARYSSGSQTEQSIEGQLRVCNEYASKNNFLIVDTYIDRARTAQNDNRPQFQQMLLDSKEKKWQYVIVYAIDRFSRDDADYGADKKILRQNGVKILSATEIIGTNADGSENLSGVLTEGLLVSLAKYYSRELSKKVKRGQYESLQKKNFLGGNVLYGYYVDNKKLLIDENEAAIIKDIFTMYANGKTADDIARNLKEREIKNKYNRYFCKNSIMTIIKNRRYVGFFKYGDYEFENYHPPIINEELFNLCAEKMNKRKRSVEKFNTYGDYILSGKLYCGECRSLMYGESGTSKTGKTYHYYKCYNKKLKNDSCSKHNVPKDYLEDVVMAITFDNLLKENTILDLIDNVVDIHNKEIKENKEIEILKKELSNNEKYLRNIIEAIKNGIYSETTQNELSNLEEEKERLQKTIQLKESQLDKPLDREQVLMFLKSFSQNKNSLSQQDKAKIVNLLIEMIILWDDRIIVIFKNGDNGHKPIKIDEIINSLSSKKDQSSPPLWSSTNSDVKFYFTRYYIIVEKKL